MNAKLLLPGGAVVLALAITGCGGSSSSKSSSNASKPAPTTGKEVSPSGDIPDNQAYVAYKAAGGYSVKVPEGWSRTTTGGATTFTDKLNSITVASKPGGAQPTAASAKRTLVPALTRKGYRITSVTVVPRSAGKAVVIKYEAPGKPNPVTGKRVTDAVEEYLFFKNGKQVILTLSGPKTADNVDPWKLVSNSLKVQ
ncbi:MAG: hypothetical protein QOF37_2493 [Thermoleophilaceae bacterium]|nr:hypothetical protein [Thermoleophilaceae bacterium]